MDTVYLVLPEFHLGEESILGAFATRELAEEYITATSNGEVNPYIYEMPLRTRPICKPSMWELQDSFRPKAIDRFYFEKR
jgi:hypothetical protein